MDIAECRRDRRILGWPDRHDRAAPAIETDSVAAVRRSVGDEIVAADLGPQNNVNRVLSARNNRNDTAKRKIIQPLTEKIRYLADQRINSGEQRI